MLTGVCIIILAAVACMMGTDMKEAKVLYYDAEFEVDDGSFKITTPKNKEPASETDDGSKSAVSGKEGEATAANKPKSKKSSLRSVGKDADPVQYSAQEIYDKLDRK